jgi:hypothetical protein
MKLTILVLALVATVLCSSIHPEFLKFMQTYDKVYANDAEFLKRMEIFKNNMKLANQWSHEGEAQYGATQFADLLPEEAAEMLLMTNLPEYEANGEELELGDNLEANPATFDWRTKGAVTPVKNQGQCGSCWAFSATENIESVYFLAGHSLPTLSPQQIVDCDTTCYGCDGGWPYRAFEYIIGFGGQDSAASYPYTARDGTCKATQNNIAATITKYNNVPSNEHTIQTSLVNVAPLSICVDASKWYLYQGGIIMASQCGTQLDHCVQLVGYDTTGSTPAWLVRNSWGTGWGEQGYLRLQMWSNTCGMDQAVSSAVSKHK